MGFDDGPDPLPLGVFEPFRGEAQPGGQPLFALNPLAELVVGFHPSRLSTVPAAVQQTGRLMPGFWSDAPHAPRTVNRMRGTLIVKPPCDLWDQHPTILPATAPRVHPDRRKRNISPLLQPTR